MTISIVNTGFTFSLFGCQKALIQINHVQCLLGVVVVIPSGEILNI